MDAVVKKEIPRLPVMGIEPSKWTYRCQIARDVHCMRQSFLFRLSVLTWSLH